MFYDGAADSVLKVEVYIIKTDEELVPLDDDIKHRMRRNDLIIKAFEEFEHKKARVTRAERQETPLKDLKDEVDDLERAHRAGQCEFHKPSIVKFFECT